MQAAICTIRKVDWFHQIHIPKTYDPRIPLQIQFHFHIIQTYISDVIHRFHRNLQQGISYTTHGSYPKTLLSSSTQTYS
ncbi:hypothetical protein Hanom_Chr04g00295571 [Helianthus anomalus]